MVGADRAGTCTFCGGGPTEAVGDAPVLWRVAVCSECLTDLIVKRFAAVKHQRTAALAKDMNAAADEIVKLRSLARREKLDPAELRAARGLVWSPRSASRTSICDRYGAPCVRAGMDLLMPDW